MTVRATLAEAAVSELQVHFLAFACDTPLGASDALEVGLPWPETIERSVPRRRAEFVFGRLAARHALAHVSPLLASAAVGIGPNREPLWPAGAIGSVTHITGLAGAAAVPACSWRFIGIDLERPARADSQHALRILALDDAELSLLRAVPPVPSETVLDTRVTQVFSAKESLYKAAFPMARRFFDFSAARLCDFQVAASGIGPEVRLVLEMREDVGGAFGKGSRWSIDVWPVPGTDASLSVLAG